MYILKIRASTFTKVRKIVSRNCKYNRGIDLLLDFCACFLIMLLGQMFFDHMVYT